MCSDQYCSCNVSIVYLREVGSLRMLCVRGWLLCRLYCSMAMFYSSFGVGVIR